MLKRFFCFPLFRVLGRRHDDGLRFVGTVFEDGYHSDWALKSRVVMGPGKPCEAVTRVNQRRVRIFDAREKRGTRNRGRS